MKPWKWRRFFSPQSLFLLSRQNSVQILPSIHLQSIKINCTFPQLVFGRESCLINWSSHNQKMWSWRPLWMAHTKPTDSRIPQKLISQEQEQLVFRRTIFSGEKLHKIWVKTFLLFSREHFLKRACLRWNMVHSSFWFFQEQFYVISTLRILESLVQRKTEYKVRQILSGNETRQIDRFPFFLPFSLVRLEWINLELLVWGIISMRECNGEVQIFVLFLLIFFKLNCLRCLRIFCLLPTTFMQEIPFLVCRKQIAVIPEKEL